MAARHDAIVIGAGVNGLTAAAYLARAGRRVLVLERRDVLGGSMVTEELAPGFRLDTCTHDVGWIEPSMVQTLGLERHGLRLLRSPATVFTPLPGGGYLALWRDVRRTAEELARHSRADASRWGAFSERVHRLAGFLGTLYAAAPPRPSARGLSDLFALAQVGRRLRGLGTEDMRELLRTLPMSVHELLGDWFENPALQGTLGASGITGLLQGPRSGGTAFLMLHHQVGSAPGVFRERTAVRGGAGALASALAGAARELGVEIRLGAEVGRVVITDRQVRGVALSGGEELHASCVVSSTDARRTFLELSDPLQLDPEFVRAVRNIRFRGASAKVNLALGELPQFRGVNGDGALLSGLISVSPSLDHLERAYDDAKYGAVSRLPYLEAVIPSLLDDSLAPAGKHVMSVRVQYAPYRLRDGVWDAARRAALGDAVIQTLAEYAPNLPDAILYREVLTPKDLEERYALTEGSMEHGELTLDQVLFMRPVPGWSRYRTPIENLFLCGASAHPGGRIAGGAGRLAAAEMLRGAEGSVR